MANLALAATKFGWQCTNCHQLFDAMWRPIDDKKIWKPPVAYNWMLDKPPFNFCPTCGEGFSDDETPLNELRIG